MDKILIEELKIFAHHGVFREENIKGQNFFVNAALSVDTEAAGISDELERSVNYASVCEVIKKVMTENTFKLIETAAQTVAVQILGQFELVKEVEIEIRKPEAPIPMEFGSVSVKIRRGWHKAVIALGSNMGDSKAYINAAVKSLEDCEYFKNIKMSSLIVTKPYGFTEQDDFLNGVLVCDTIFSPCGLLDHLHKLENQAQRKREIHWGPRTLDLDIIFYDDNMIDTANLTIPHPDMHNRDFVLRPAAEIIPEYRHPILGLTIKELLERLEKND